jgi:hypothetical protein
MAVRGWESNAPERPSRSIPIPINSRTPVTESAAIIRSGAREITSGVTPRLRTWCDE